MADKLNYGDIKGDTLGTSRIFFNEELHKYTDELDNVLKSVTTIIGDYSEKFSDNADKIAKICAKIGKNPRHPKYLKYKGKSAKQLKEEWKRTTDIALDNGNRKHNYLENVVKTCNNYNRVNNIFIKDRIFTVADIIKHKEVGKIDLEALDKSGLEAKFSKIYNILKNFINSGWSLYAEIGVYNIDLLVSGLIDLLLVKGNSFFIVDWKTNKSPIRFESGFYVKDNHGNVTDEFTKTNKYLKYPLHRMPASVGHKYSLQLSTYAYLVELFGLEYKGSIICHIRTLPDGSDTVDIVNIKYYKEEVENMLYHYYSNQVHNKQTNLFI